MKEKQFSHLSCLGPETLHDKKKLNLVDIFFVGVKHQNKVAMGSNIFKKI